MYTYAPAGVVYGQPGGTYGDWGFAPEPAAILDSSLVVGVRHHAVLHQLDVAFSVTLESEWISVHEPAPLVLASGWSYGTESAIAYEVTSSIDARIETVQGIRVRPELTSATRIALESSVPSPSHTVTATRRTADLVRAIAVAVAATEHP